MANTQTTQDAAPNTKKQFTQADIDKSVKAAAEALQKQSKVKVSIPKYLAKRIGSKLPLGINGAVIHVPVDGKKYDVPKSYAALLDETLNNLKI